MGFKKAAYMLLGCPGLAHTQKSKLEPEPLKDAESSSSLSSSASSSSSSSTSDDGSCRVRLSDGRCLAYRETGVPKNESKYKVIIVHGFASSKEMKFVASQVSFYKIHSHNYFKFKNRAFLVEILTNGLVFFDRAGYGESDPNPKRSVKTEAMDIEELADKLQLGSKFFVIGVSFGTYPTWSCLKRIPHRQKHNLLNTLLLKQC